jgi:hypothetical protein
VRGKKAAQAANRRAKEAASTVGQLQALLAEERAAHRQEVITLSGEIKRLRTDASRIAQAEVERTLKRIEDERRMRGMSDDIATDLMYQKDKFVMNACRYISMTTGRWPLQALPMVMTWMLDDDFVGVLNEVNLLLKCGLPSGGWVAQMLKDNKHALRPIAKRNRARGTHEAISLDRAEREGHPSIHPDYDPRWYPRVEYAGIVLVDEEGNPVSDEEAVAS